LLVVQLIQRLRERQWFVNTSSLFRHPKLYQLAKAIKESREAGLKNIDVPENVLNTEFESIDVEEYRI
jgi:hypothetical protein